MFDDFTDPSARADGWEDGYTTDDYPADWYDDELADEEQHGSFAEVGFAATAPRTATIIIPGTALPPRWYSPRRPRPLSMQILVASVTLCLVLAGTVSLAPQANGASFTFGGSIDTLANAVNFSPTGRWISYHAHPGDTFESIAAEFGVSEGGIFELNHLNALAEVQVGQVYTIATDPSYGVNYLPPLPPGLNSCLYGLPDVNIVKTAGFQFCAMAGKTNGLNQLCAPNYASGDPTKYNLLPPEDPTTSAWRQSFHQFHSGVDLSTGVIGTPLRAAQDGVVIFAGWDQGNGGYTVKINFCGGLAASYCHMVPGSFRFTAGQAVHRGDIIGLQGQSGRAYGPHVHFMLWWNNIPFDPLCAYGSLDGHTQATHYGGCPPNGMDHTSRWWH